MCSRCRVICLFCSLGPILQALCIAKPMGHYIGGVHGKRYTANLHNPGQHPCLGQRLANDRFRELPPSVDPAWFPSHAVVPRYRVTGLLHECNRAINRMNSIAYVSLSVSIWSTLEIMPHTKGRHGYRNDSRIGRGSGVSVALNTESSHVELRMLRQNSGTCRDLLPLALTCLDIRWKVGGEEKG